MDKPIATKRPASERRKVRMQDSEPINITEVKPLPKGRLGFRLDNSHELAWAAGFFDGEGTIDAHKGSRERLDLRVQVDQVDRRLLDRFVKAVGEGSVGPRIGKSSNDQDFYYEVRGGPAETVLERLWPYLSEPKRDQALKAGLDVESFQLKHGFDELFGVSEVGDCLEVSITNLQYIKDLPEPVAYVRATRIWLADEIRDFAKIYKLRREMRQQAAGNQAQAQ